jgi:hypothetical protein
MQFRATQLQALYDLIQAEKAQELPRSASEKVALSALVEVDCKVYNKLQRLGMYDQRKITVQFTATQLAALAWLFGEWHHNLPASLHGVLGALHQRLS